MTIRNFKTIIFKILMYLSLLIVIGSLGMVLVVVILKGGTVLFKNPEIIWTPPGSRYLLGGGGGFLHAILGSLYLVVPATAIATILGACVAIYLQSDYCKPKRARRIRTMLEILWGTPSIVYGMFILSIMIIFHQSGMLLTGIIALALLEIPIITRYADESIQAVPFELKESVFSLGVTRFENAKVMLKYASSGIVAGILIGLGRGIGDAASVMFTVGTSNSLPGGLLEPVTAMPILIFQQASSCYPGVRQHAYAAAFLLVVLIGVLNIISRMVSRHFQKYL